MIYGYARVSSKEQNEDRQMVALRKFGCDRIYLDKQSGKNFERIGWKSLLAALGADDLLVVESIDRIGRNYEELLEQWRTVTKEKRAAIVVLDMPLLDTRNHKDLTGTLIADIVLQLLSYVAQTEREFIRKRQAEGISAARMRGVHLGRPAIYMPDTFSDVAGKFMRGEWTADRAAAYMEVSHSTFRRWMKKWMQEGMK